MSANDIFANAGFEEILEGSPAEYEDWQQSKSGSHRCPDGTIINVRKKEITNACCLEVIAGTNGYQGGDAGHGSRTFIRVMDTGCTSMTVKRLENKWGEQGFSVELAGDCELQNLIWGLQFVVDVLRDQAKEGDEQ